MMGFLAGQAPPNNAPYRTPQVHLSAGQSWRGNYYSALGANGFNPQTQTYLTPSVTSGAYPSNVLSVGAGINLPGNILNTKLIGLTSAMLYPVPGFANDTSSALTIGRCAVLAQQLLRLANGKPLVPIIEANVSFPSSTWVSGPGGGLGPPTSTFTGTSSGTTLTVAGISGSIIINQYVQGVGVADQTQITAQLTGTAGSNGTYTTTKSQTIGPVAMTSLSSSWRTQQLVIADLASALPYDPLKLSPVAYRSVGWTQGGSFTTTDPNATITEWTAMEAAYDALSLPGAGAAGLLFYVGIRAPNTFDTQASQAVLGAAQFVRANANGRTVGTSPWYQWKFNGADAIHTGDYGTQRNGEFEGLAKYITEDEGTFFRPLWRSLTAPITRNGQMLTVPFDRPTGLAFASGVMSWMSDPDDGIQVWPQYGFHVRRNSVELTVTPSIVGMTVQLSIAEPIVAGDLLEVSYAFYGPGGPSTGDRTGVGGNLTMPGPSSQLFPGKTINSWAWPFIETVTI